MPTPKPNEGRDAFLDRCIPIVISEGRDPDQAIAICLAYYDGDDDSADPKDVSDRKALWYALDRKARTFDDKYIRKMRKAFREDLEYLTKASSIAQLKDRPSMGKFESQIREMYFDVGESFAKQGYQQFRKQKNAPDFRNFIRDFYEERGIETTKQVVDTLHKDIIRDVVKAQSSGASFDDIKKGIVAKYFPKGVGQTGSQVDWRVKRVVRTEVHAVSSYARQRGVEQTGIPYHKEWISVPDMRRRSHHAEADGQKVPLDQPFYVGGENVMFPGDGSARNAVNCRCREGYIQSDEVEPQDERAIDRIDGGNIAPDPRNARTFGELETNDLNEIKQAFKDLDPFIDIKIPRTTDIRYLKAQYKALSFIIANTGGLKSRLFYEVARKGKNKRGKYGGTFGYFDPNTVNEIGKAIPTNKDGFAPERVKVFVFGGKYEDTMQEYARNSKAGWFYENAGVEALMAHEMAHYLSTVQGLKRRGFFGKMVDGRFQMFAKSSDGKSRIITTTEVLHKDVLELTYEKLGIDSTDKVQYMRATAQARADARKVFGKYSYTNESELVAMAFEYNYKNPGKNAFAKAVMESIFQLYKEAFK